MTLTDTAAPANGKTRRTTAKPPPIGTTPADLARLLAAFAELLTAHPELPDLHCVMVEYHSTDVAWGLELLTSDFDDDGRTAVDTWAEALDTTAAAIAATAGGQVNTYAAATTLAGFPILVWATCQGTPQPAA